MSLNTERLKKQQLETAKSAGGGDSWKPSEGKNLVRLFPFSHKVTKEDVENNRYEKVQLGKSFDELARAVTRHFNVSSSGIPVISNDAIMDRWRKLNKSKSKEDQAVAKKISPATGYFINMVDTNDVAKGMLTWACPKSVFNKILTYINDPDYGEEILGIKGRDIVVVYESAKEGSDKYQIMLRKEGKSEELPDDLDSEVLDLYDPENEGIFGVIDSGEEAASSAKDKELDKKEEEDEAEEKPKPKSGKSGKSDKKEDDDDPFAGFDNE